MLLLFLFASEHGTAYSPNGEERERERSTCVWLSRKKYGNSVAQQLFVHSTSSGKCTFPVATVSANCADSLFYIPRSII